MHNSPRKPLTEQLWLAYYNRALRDRGIITDAAYHKMATKLANRTTRPQR